MEFMNEWWGIQEDITPLEIAARALVMFLIALLMVRLSSMRSFGKGNAFDNIISILLGGVLSRGVVGATPFFSAVAGGIIIIVVHQVLAKLSFYNRTVEYLSKGKTTVLYKDQEFLHQAMKKANITKSDIYEELRLQCQADTLDDIEQVLMERPGELSFIKKNEPGT